MIEYSRTLGNRSPKIRPHSGAENICEIKAETTHTHTHTLKSQKQTKMTRTLEQQDRDERQNQYAQIYIPPPITHIPAHMPKQT